MEKYHFTQKGNEKPNEVAAGFTSSNREIPHFRDAKHFPQASASSVFSFDSSPSRIKHTKKPPEKVLSGLGGGSTCEAVNQVPMRCLRRIGCPQTGGIDSVGAVFGGHPVEARPSLMLSNSPHSGPLLYRR